MKLDPNARYAKSDEWVRLEGQEAICGITDYAQDQLSDIVYVELPTVGESFAKGEAFATVESVKAAAECYMPMGGEVTAVNEALKDAPELVNQDPYGEGWFIRFRPHDPSEFDDLMSPQEYEKYCQER